MERLQGVQGPPKHDRVGCKARCSCSWHPASHAWHGSLCSSVHSVNPKALATHAASCPGSMDIAGKTMDIELAKAGLHMMIEKPISMRPVEEVERLAQVFAYLSIAHYRGATASSDLDQCMCVHLRLDSLSQSSQIPELCNHYDHKSLFAASSHTHITLSLQTVTCQHVQETPGSACCMVLEKSCFADTGSNC